MASNVSDRGATFVARHEGFERCPVLDRLANPPVWTIGYGQTEGVTSKTPCTSERAARHDLHRRLNHRYNPAKLLPHLDLRQEEVDALASLAYNEGPGILTDPGFSNLARRLRSPWAKLYVHRKRIYRQELPKWVYAGGVKYQGLVTRRADEVRLACTGHYT